jgi:alcohol dehydrogenase, propanol-preferring
MLAKASGLVRIPDDLSSADAAPLLCAGITTFSALRNSPAKAGDLVAVVGIGGLGHLGVQYACHMGFEVAAISRGADTAQLARKLGAHHYIDSASTNPAAALQALGGAQVILVTASSAAVVSQTFRGLRPNGVSIVVGVGPEPIQTSISDLIWGSRRLEGSLTGNSATGDATLKFSVLSGISALIETVPLEQAAEAYAKMMAGKARFRMVLTMNDSTTDPGKNGLIRKGTNYESSGTSHRITSAETHVAKVWDPFDCRRAGRGGDCDNYPQLEWLGGSTGRTSNQ